MIILTNKRRFFVALFASVFLFAPLSVYAVWPAVGAFFVWAGHAVRFLKASNTVRTTVAVAQKIPSGVKNVTGLSLNSHLSVAGHLYLLSQGISHVYVVNSDQENPANHSQAVIEVNLNDFSPQRQNPDPETWNDALQGDVEPTPKTLQPKLPVSISDSGASGGGSEGTSSVPGVINKGGGSIDFVDGSYIFKVNPTLVETTAPAYIEYYCAEFVVDSPKCLRAATLAGVYIKRVFPDPYSNPVNIAGIDISLEKFNSSKINNKVVVVDSEKSLRYTWTVSPLSFSFITGEFYSSPILCGKHSYRSNGSVYDKKVYCDNPNSGEARSEAASTFEQAVAQVNKRTYFSKTDSSYTDVVRFESGYAHVVKVEHICGSGQSFNENTSSCTMNNVVKPATLPCEVIYKDNSWQKDDRNPNCDLVSDSLGISGNVVHLKSSDSEVEIMRNADGTYEIKTKDSDGNWKTVNTSPYSKDSNGAPVKDITDSDNGKFHTVAGVGNGNGNGSGSCGGKDQSPCSIDDSGFDGKGDDIKGEFDKLSEGDDKKLEDLEGYAGKAREEDFGFEADWFPKLWPDEIPCRALNFPVDFSDGALKGKWSFEVDFCSQISDIRQVIHWIVYLVGAFYIFRRLMRVNEPGWSSK
jgi:hypothetical protein